MRRLQPRFLLSIHQVHLQPLSARWHYHRGWLKAYVEDDKRITACFTVQGKQGALHTQTATERSGFLGSTVPDIAYRQNPKRCCSSEERTICLEISRVLWPPGLFVPFYLPLVLRLLNSLFLASLARSLPFFHRFPSFSLFPWSLSHWAGIPGCCLPKPPSDTAIAPSCASHLLVTKTGEVPFHWGLSTLSPPCSENLCSKRPFQGHKDGSWSQASQQEGCAGKDMHMPVQSAQHPCRCNQVKEEGKGSAAKGSVANSQLFWIPNHTPLSPPRSLPSLLEAARFQHKLPGGPWTRGDSAHTAAEHRWVEHLRSVGGKGITHLSTGHSP